MPFTREQVVEPRIIVGQDLASAFQRVENDHLSCLGQEGIVPSAMGVPDWPDTFGCTRRSGPIRVPDGQSDAGDLLDRFSGPGRERVWIIDRPNGPSLGVVSPDLDKFVGRK